MYEYNKFFASTNQTYSIEELNNFSSHGWELVTIEKVDNGSWWIFKRLKQ